MNSPSRHGAKHDERLGTVGDGVGEGSVGRVVGEVLLAGEETDEGAALLRDVIADGPAQHGIARLQGVEDRTLRDGAATSSCTSPSTFASFWRWNGRTTRIMGS